MSTALESMEVSRLATRTVYKIVFIGSYIGGMIISAIDILLRLAGVSQNVIDLDFSFNVNGVNLLDGWVGLLLLPITEAFIAALIALTFGSFLALGLYAWHFLEPLQVSYAASSTASDDAASEPSS